MGLLDKLTNILGIRKKECNVLVVGLDNSGKSTVLNHFKPEETKNTEIVPTVGFNVEKFKSRRKMRKKNVPHISFRSISFLFCYVPSFRAPWLFWCLPPHS